MTDELFGIVLAIYAVFSIFHAIYGSQKKFFRFSLSLMVVALVALYNGIKFGGLIMILSLLLVIFAMAIDIKYSLLDKHTKKN
jgi:hypothetical protein